MLQPRIHVDKTAGHLIVVWVSQPKTMEGGEFILADYGFFFPKHHNMLFWFDEHMYPGTALSRDVENGHTYTLATSILAKLFTYLCKRGARGLQPDEEQ